MLVISSGSSERGTCVAGFAADGVIARPNVERLSSVTAQATMQKEHQMDGVAGARSSPPLLARDAVAKLE